MFSHCCRVIFCTLVLCCNACRVILVMVVTMQVAFWSTFMLELCWSSVCRDIACTQPRLINTLIVSNDEHSLSYHSVQHAANCCWLCELLQNCVVTYARHKHYSIPNCWTFLILLSASALRVIFSAYLSFLFQTVILILMLLSVFWMLWIKL